MDNAITMLSAPSSACSLASISPACSALTASSPHASNARERVAEFSWSQVNSVALLIAKSAHMPGLEAKSAYCVVTAPWKRFFLPLVRGLVVR